MGRPTEHLLEIWSYDLGKQLSGVSVEQPFRSISNLLTGLRNGVFWKQLQISGDVRLGRGPHCSPDFSGRTDIGNAAGQ
jgi:hypothetical protein